MDWIYNIISLVIGLVSLAVGLWSLNLTMSVRAAIAETKKKIYIRDRKQDMLLKLDRIDSSVCTAENALCLIAMMKRILNEPGLEGNKKNIEGNLHKLENRYGDIKNDHAILYGAEIDLTYAGAYAAVEAYLNTLET